MVPRLFAVCEGFKDGDILISECVAYGLDRETGYGSDGRITDAWCVNDEQLTNENKVSMVKFAVSSLRSLHERGFTHDLRWRNLRVEIVLGDWQMWRIEVTKLTRMTESEKEGMMEYEIDWCRNLFQEGKKRAQNSL